MASGNPIQDRPDTSRRRSQRVILSMPVLVRTADGPKNDSFAEKTHTLVVNAHGALIALAGKVKRGQKLRLTNVSTQAEELCRVVHLGGATDGKIQVGVEFLNPAPDFWHIAFPPADWVIPAPEPATADPS